MAALLRLLLRHPGLAPRCHARLSAWPASTINNLLDADLPQSERQCSSSSSSTAAEAAVTLVVAEVVAAVPLAGLAAWRNAAAVVALGSERVRRRGAAEIVGSSGSGVAGGCMLRADEPTHQACGF